jgi:ABC-type nitrate/sulfonate/bicarbonate transport system substrate-binding protein
VSLRLAVSYQVPNNLPLMLALQRGDFARAGLNVQVQVITGSSAAILPQLSQGQIDIAQTVPAPALFNQAAQGFGAKLVAGGDIARPGRIPSAILLVEKDEAAQIQQLSDLKGKTIEGAAPGSPISLTVETAVREAGLAPGQDVTITYRVKDPSDFLALIRNHAADVIGATSSTEVQVGDYAVAWKDSNEIIPWYQATLLATSSQFLSANRPAVEKFVEVELQAARDIDATNGVWTDDLVSLFAQQAGISPQDVEAQGQIPYFDPNGTVSIDSLQQTQAFWVQQAQVPQAVDVQTLVDPSIAQEAASSLGSGS